MKTYPTPESSAAYASARDALLAASFGHSAPSYADIVAEAILSLHAVSRRLEARLAAAQAELDALRAAIPTAKTSTSTS